MLFDLEEAIMFTPKPQEYTDPVTGETKKKQIKFFPDVYKDRIGKSYTDYIAGHQMNLLVTIPAESRRMNVGKDVIRVLGSPTYICVLQRKDRKSIAITPCAAEHPMSFKVPDRLLTDGQCRMMINGIQFIQVLLEANGLAVGKDHQFKGRYDAEKNAVVISLEENEFENERQSKIGLSL